MMVEKICQVCGAKYLVPHWRESKSKYCSRKCSDIAKRANNNVVCPVCGKHFHLKQSHINRCKGNYGFACSKDCFKEIQRIRMTGSGNHQYGLKGSLNASYKGDEIRHKNNNNVDIMVYVPSHIYSDNRGRVCKHRLIVEQNRERFNSEFFIVVNGKYYLKKEYSVHHKDGNHDNNDIDNLVVCTRSEHTSIHNRQKVIIRDSKTGRITGVLKQGELLENPEVDNQQPSIFSNDNEGSETNSRLLMCNDKESNADTSALPTNSSDDIVRTIHITNESIEYEDKEPHR